MAMLSLCHGMERLRAANLFIGTVCLFFCFVFLHFGKMLAHNPLPLPLSQQQLTVSLSLSLSKMIFNSVSSLFFSPDHDREKINNNIPCTEAGVAQRVRVFVRL